MSSLDMNTLPVPNLRWRRDTPDGSESPKKSRNSLNYKEFDHNEGRREGGGRGGRDDATVNKELQHQIRGREPLFCPSLFK